VVKRREQRYLTEYTSQKVEERSKCSPLERHLASAGPLSDQRRMQRLLPGVHGGEMSPTR